MTASTTRSARRSSCRRQSTAMRATIVVAMTREPNRTAGAPRTAKYGSAGFAGFGASRIHVPAEARPEPSSVTSAHGL